MGVVGKAIVLLLGIVQKQAELHPLTGHFAVGQAAKTGEYRGQSRRIGLRKFRACIAALFPLLDHPGEIIDEQIRNDRQILTASIAVAIRAFRRVVVRGFAITGPGVGAVEILPPQQKLDRMIAGRNVSLDFFGLMERIGQQLLRNAAGIDLAAVDGQRRVCDHIGGVKRIAVRRRTVTFVHVIDQTFIKRPSIHLAFPLIDDLVAEAEGLGLHVRRACREPSLPRCFQCFLARRGHQLVDGCFQRFGSRQRVLISGERQIGIVVDNLRNRCGRHRHGKDSG